MRALTLRGVCACSAFKQLGECVDEYYPDLESVEGIKNAIESITDQLVEEKQAISDDCIVIDVSGRGFPNLTLVDLPGTVFTQQRNHSHCQGRWRSWNDCQSQGFGQAISRNQTNHHPCSPPCQRGHPQLGNHQSRSRSRPKRWSLHLNYHKARFGW